MQLAERGQLFGELVFANRKQRLYQAQLGLRGDARKRILGDTSVHGLVVEAGAVDEEARACRAQGDATRGLGQCRLLVVESVVVEFALWIWKVFGKFSKGFRGFSEGFPGFSEGFQGFWRVSKG